MFDIASSEFLLVMLIALVVIGPKDLPKLLRVIGRWTAKARAVAGQFRMHLDDMVRESELKDLEKQWQAENERIMREFPSTEDISAESSKASGAVSQDSSGQQSSPDRPNTGKGE